MLHTSSHTIPDSLLELYLSDKYEEHYMCHHTIKTENAIHFHLSLFYFLFSLLG